VPSIGKSDSQRSPVIAELFAALVVLPTLVGVAFLATRSAGQIREDAVWLLVWGILTAGVELMPVPTWHGVQVSMGFPLLIAVALIYLPAEASLVALLGSFDPREFKGEVTLLRALFNRSQVALAVLASSSVFHAVAKVEEPWTKVLPAALLATLVDYSINLGLVAVVVSLAYRVRLHRALRELLGRGQEFLVSYLGLGVVGTVLAKFYKLPGVGIWSVITVLAPLLFARQMFFRSRALEEAHKELQDREQVLRALSNRMAEERQDERAQIAAYLHDDLAQLLFRLSIQVDVARRHLDTGRTAELSEELEKIKETKALTADRVRALIRDLDRSPLGHHGLAEALQGFIGETARDSEVRFHTDIADVRLPPPIALLAYHIARESVMNAVKHANANNMWLTLRPDGDAVELILRDDGAGFDAEAPAPEGHFGLAMMRERATVGGGTYRLESAAGAGTTITVRFPTSLLQDGEATPVSTSAGSGMGDASRGTRDSSQKPQVPPSQSVPASPPRSSVPSPRT